jgi:CRISPR type I-D-associated protein Csc3/Cas10d
MEKEKPWIEELVVKSLSFYLPYRPPTASTYVLERPLREAFKAIQDSPPTVKGEALKQMLEGYVYNVVERLLERREVERHARILSFGESLRDSVKCFVDYFYDEVFVKICEGKIAKARRFQNEILNGYTFILLGRLPDEWVKEKEKKEAD